MSKINFLTQWNMFNKLCDGILPIKAQIVYYKLLKWSNYFGLGEPFQLTNRRIMVDCEMSREKSFIDARNLLKQRGFIDFKAGKKGSPSTYILLDLTKYTFNLQVNSEAYTEVNTEVQSEVNTEVNTEVNNGFLKLNNNKTKTKTKTKKEINKEKPPKHKYGEYQNVLLSDDDLQKLQEEFPSDWQERIENVSEYCQSHGKSYKDYLATIRNWARREAKQGNRSAAPIRKNDAQAGYQRMMQLLGEG